MPDLLLELFSEEIPARMQRRAAADLQKLVAPIALYPDALIAHILPACTAGLDVVQAARFLRKNNGNISHAARESEPAERR